MCVWMTCRGHIRWGEWDRSRVREEDRKGQGRTVVTWDQVRKDQVGSGEGQCCPVATRLSRTQRGSPAWAPEQEPNRDMGAQQSCELKLQKKGSGLCGPWCPPGAKAQS